MNEMRIGARLGLPKRTDFERDSSEVKRLQLQYIADTRVQHV